MLRLRISLVGVFSLYLCFEDLNLIELQKLLIFDTGENQNIESIQALFSRGMQRTLTLRAFVDLKIAFYQLIIQRLILSNKACLLIKNRHFNPKICT